VPLQIVPGKLELSHWNVAWSLVGVLEVHTAMCGAVQGHWQYM